MQDRQIAIIDDDPFVIAHLKRSFSEQFPGVEVHGIAAPMAPAGYDVYIVDKDFDGVSLGCDVVSRVRDVAPDALVIAYSAFLDKPFLRKLMGKRCAGAFDKGSLKELEDMIQMIKDFLRENKRETGGQHGLRGTLNAISSLMREWNLRLEDNKNQNTRRTR